MVPRMTRVLPFLAIIAVFFATTSRSTGFVYLGNCDPQAGWRSTTFDGLPACDGVSLVERPIVAKQGMKARDKLPEAGKYGQEVARIARGQKVTLVGPVHRKDDGSSWGEIVLP
jgi:hypothetical protein